MLQTTIALIVVLFFLSRTYWQKRHKKITKLEFIFWLIFWLLAGFVVVFIKKIDELVASLGFSASGINVLSYLSIAVIFYLIFKIFIKIEKIEKEITKIIREIAINNKN